jgi:hypothetical protein
MDLAWLYLAVALLGAAAAVARVSADIRHLEVEL